MNNELIIKEIYKTLQGEGPSSGQPMTLVRLTGCSLRCSYCDSEYSFKGGETQSLDQIIKEVKKQGNQLVLVTGGEPMDQEACPDLLQALLAENFDVELETAGHKSLAQVPSGVRVLMDVKTPSSNMQQHFDKDNLDCLDEDDLLKFVIAHQEDFDWVCTWIKALPGDFPASFWLSPVNQVEASEGQSISHQALEPKQLAKWILECDLPLRFQMQQHKIIWGPQISR